MMLSEAREERIQADMALERRYPSIPVPAAPEVPQDPRIGMLMRNGVAVYYATIEGCYLEGSLRLVREELELSEIEL